MKHFLMAGVDFIISRGEPYFLEANSSPGSVAMKLLADDGRNPLEKFGRLLKRRFRPRRVASLYSTKDAADSIRVSTLSRFFEVHACPVDQRGEELVSDEGVRFKPDLIIFNRLKFSQHYPYRVRRINSDSVIRITLDKHLSTVVVGNAGVPVPETYLSLGSAMARDIVERAGLVDYVVKGNFGQAGAGIKFSSEGDVHPVRGVKIIQRHLPVDPHPRAHYWDVRAILVNGKFQGATVRYSDSPAVNLHRGGRMELASPEIEELVKKEAERAVRAIDRTASAIESRA